ncbi:UNVERIFIED_CONTAM: hypothetical protein GTU68_025004 [Idotea baltica]|nr:hypothetical protein [Idotea baltica]
MFTGLVEGLGQVVLLTKETAGIRLAVRPEPDSIPVAEISIGDSISISGCCLTVVKIDADVLEFEAGLETLAKTNLGKLAEGHFVNLERSLAVGGRLGGHFVQGHVDGQAAVDQILQNGEWVDMWFQCPASLTQLMVPKGSITIDGISLTLVNVEAERFSIALIPHTLQVTTLGKRRVGDPVNIEQDILGKYVQKLLQGQKDGPLFDALT